LRHYPLDEKVVVTVECGGSDAAVLDSRINASDEATSIRQPVIMDLNWRGRGMTAAALETNVTSAPDSMRRRRIRSA
jgi:hypothetical protein